MNPAEQISEVLRPFLGAEFDAKAERKARKALKAAGFDSDSLSFAAGAKHREGPPPPKKDEELVDYRHRIAEFEALPHPGIAWLEVSMGLRVGESG